MGLSHTATPEKLGSNTGESDQRSRIRPEGPLSPLFSPKRGSLAKRIPEGVIFGEVPLEACKAYPIHIFDGLDVAPRIAYADRNTHKEDNRLSVKLLPNGGKTAPHPQIVFFINGPYHTELLGYNQSDPYAWTTWMELHLDARELDKIVDALIRAKLRLEGINT